MKGLSMKIALIAAMATVVVATTVIVISIGLFQKTCLFLDQNR